jgi:hypothetical protein
MESQPPQSPPPNAKPGTTSAIAGSAAPAARPGGRSYPKPPPLLLRLIGLCLRPESWAEAAQYPTRFTMVPLFLVIVLGSLGIGVGETWHTFRIVRDFAAGYDAKGYPALEINSAGVLSAKGPLEHPIRLDLPNTVIYVDPTGKTTADSINTPSLFVNDKELALVGPAGPLFSFALPSVLQAYGVTLPDAQKTKTVSSETMVRYLDDHAAPYIAAASVFVSLAQAIGETLWALLMLFMLRPLIILAAAGPRVNPDAPDRRLILPRRVAYRMAAALLVPLVMLGALLRTIGHPVQDLLGPQGAMLFWLVAAGCLAAYTGLTARKMYGPKERRR